MLANVELAIISGVLGAVAGFVMHRSDFCFAGMFRDLFLFRQTFMLRILLLLITASMLLFEVGRWCSGFQDYPFPLVDPPSLVSLLGGIFFGAGMVLAGGCVVGTLYKLGAGSLLSGLALVGLIIGSALYAEIHPLWARLFQMTRLDGDQLTVPQLLGISPTIPVLLLTGLGGWICWRWQRGGGLVRPGFTDGYLQPWRAALCLSALTLSSWLLAGMPLGITTAYTKWSAALEGWLIPGHAKSVGYFQLEALAFVPPLGKEMIRGGPGPEWDAFAVIQYPLIAGIVLGSAISAIRLKEFRLHLKLPWRQIVSACTGGIIMGMAARMGQACNIWHLLGGVPILAMQSLLFLLGLFPGAWLGSRILARWVLR